MDDFPDKVLYFLTPVLVKYEIYLNVKLSYNSLQKRLFWINSALLLKKAHEFSKIYLLVKYVHWHVLPGYSGFLPLSKNMHVRLIGDSKLSLVVSVGVVVCLVCLCVVLWWTGDLSRVYPASRPMIAGIGSSPPWPDWRIKRVYKMDWLDGWCSLGGVTYFSKGV